jgi:hypothetical protein
MANKNRACNVYRWLTSGFEKAVILGQRLVLKANGGADNSALLLGGGTGGSPATTAVANKNFVEVRGETTATTAGSDTRTAYLRLYLNGATTGGGDAVRAFATVGAAIGTAHGAHNSASFGTNGKVTGQAIAGRNTLHVPNRELAAGGTYYAAQAEIYCDGNSADISPVTKHAILSLNVAGGNATAQNLVKNAISLDLSAGTDGTGNMVYTHTHDPTNAAGSIRILVNGTARYLKFWAAE